MPNNPAVPIRVSPPKNRRRFSCITCLEPMTTSSWSARRWEPLIAKSSPSYQQVRHLTSQADKPDHASGLDRKAERKGRSLAGLALEPYPSSMQLDELLGESQTEAGALMLSGHVGSDLAEL